MEPESTNQSTEISSKHFAICEIHITSERFVIFEDSIDIQKVLGQKIILKICSL
jgi:hypothetical protein